MKVNAKRFLSLLLSLALFLAIPVVSAQEAAASSSSKVYVPVEVRDTGSDSIQVTKYVYNKKGLCIEEQEWDDTAKKLGKDITKYKYNKYGDVKSNSHYDGYTDKTDSKCKYIYKSGRLVKQKYYDLSGKSSTLDTTIIYNYKKGKLVQEIWKSGDREETTTYRTNGTIAKAEIKENSYTDIAIYDKKGNIIKSIVKDSDGTKTSEYENTYNKKGRLGKAVEFYTDEQGKKEKSSIIYYNYNKKGKLASSKEYYVNDQGKKHWNSTTSYKYDKKGRLIRTRYTNDMEATSTTYNYNKAGLLTKAVHKEKDQPSCDRTITLEYKAIPVSKSLKKKVKARTRHTSDFYIGFID